MVDIIKFPPHVRTFFPSNTHNLRCRPSCQQRNLLKHCSNTNNNPENKSIYPNNRKSWIGNRSTKPTRLLDVSTTPYSIHRKIMYQELTRPSPTAVDTSPSAKIKQRQHRNSKDTITTTTVTNAGTNTMSGTTYSNGVRQNSCLYDRLSKHVTIKPEPLHPTNNLINTETNTLTSWQRYWTSTHAQRRRKDANDPEPVLHRARREQSVRNQKTHLVITRNSPKPHNKLYRSHSRTPSPRRSKNNSQTKSYVSETTFDKQMSFLKEDNNSRATNQVATVELIASSLIPSSIDISPSRSPSKTPTIIQFKSTDTDEEKSMVLSTSPFKTDSQIIEEVSNAQFQPKPIETKVYKLLLPSVTAKIRKDSPTIRKTRSKPTEKNQLRISSPSKLKYQVLPEKPQATTVSTMITTVPTSKHSVSRWAEAYVGFRIDPPTPPSSPSLLIWLHDNDQNDDYTPFEKSEFFEHNLTFRILKG